MTLREAFADFGMDELCEWIVARQPPLLFERSLRLQPDTIEARRCLFSFPTPALGTSAETEVLQICRSMSSPEQQLRAIQRFFRGAHHVHFGFEYASGTVIGKCYLELGNDDSANPHPRQGSQLKFLGYKWSMNDDSIAVVSRYRTLVTSTWDQLLQTMQQQVSDHFHAGLTSLLHEFQPHDRVAVTDLHPLEVVEEGSDRRSYDLNVYAHERPVAAVANPIRAVAESLNCDLSPLESWLAAHHDATVGHIAIGHSRTGQPFVTIYHSADINAVVLR